MDARPLALTASCKICTTDWRPYATIGYGGFASSARYWPAESRVFAIAYLIRPKDYLARSPMCFNCIRFRKNALKERSTLFNWLDSI